jgi:hypothetical protein
MMTEVATTYDAVVVYETALCLSEARESCCVEIYVAFHDVQSPKGGAIFGSSPAVHPLLNMRDIVRFFSWRDCRLGV